MNEKQKLLLEFNQRAGMKCRSLNIDECPWSREEALAYQEGWNAAWQWAFDILNDIVIGK